MKTLKREFTLSDLWISSHGNPSDFFVSSWQKGESATPMLVVRLLLSAVAASIFIWSLIEGASPHWLIYLTNWGVLLVTATTLTALIVSVMAKCGRFSSDSQQLPWYASMYWFLSNINVTIAVLITILYWALLFDNEAEREPRAFGLDISTHALNSGLALTELLISRTPHNFAHFYQPLGLGLWYAAFSAIYYAAGGTDAFGNPFIYEVLDWRNGYRAGTIVGVSAVGALAVYFVLWVLIKIRNKLSEITVQTTSQNLPLAPPLTPEPNTVARIV